VLQAREQVSVEEMECGARSNNDQRATRPHRRPWMLLVLAFSMVRRKASCGRDENG
jgi:hypothetical protein